MKILILVLGLIYCPSSPEYTYDTKKVIIVESIEQAIEIWGKTENKERVMPGILFNGSIEEPPKLFEIDFGSRTIKEIIIDNNPIHPTPKDKNGE